VTAFDQEVDLLFEAAFTGDVARLLSLLDADRSLVWDMRAGLTALHLAAFAGNLEAADLILMKGADVNASQGEGTPLFQACLGGHEPVARLLLEYGAQPDGATDAGETPIMAAALTGNEPLARLLIEKGADVNKQTASGKSKLDESRDVAGETALHLAAGAGHAAFVRLLLEHGAKADLRDNAGLTPLDWAHLSGRVEIDALLAEQPD